MGQTTKKSYVRKHPNSFYSLQLNEKLLVILAFFWSIYSSQANICSDTVTKKAIWRKLGYSGAALKVTMKFLTW